MIEISMHTRSRLSVGYESSKRASPLCSSSSANKAQRLGPNGYSLSTGLLLLYSCSFQMRPVRDCSVSTKKNELLDLSENSRRVYFATCATSLISLFIFSSLSSE